MNTRKVRFSVVDIVIIFVLLIIGIVFYTGFWRDVYIAILRPPILLSRDWQNSNMQSFYKGSIDNGVEYKVMLSNSYSQGNKNVAVYIEQTTTWYVDPQDVIKALRKPENYIDRDRYDRYSFYRYDEEGSFFEGFYEMPLPAEIVIPSSLKCRDWDESHCTCVYFGYHKHLFTQIWFMSDNKSALVDSGMNELIRKAGRTMIEVSSSQP